jgi:hypothetical protein
MEPSERVTHLIARLDERFHERGNTCEVCDHQNDWGWPQNTIHVGGQEMLFTLCRNCGLVRMHAAIILEGVASDEP